MPARDRIHAQIVAALRHDGWTITHDPYRLVFEDEPVYIDLGAERVVAAQRGREKIAVEIKSFISASVMADVQQALGQYLVYVAAIAENEPERQLYLALQLETAMSVLTRPAVQKLFALYGVWVVVIDIEAEEVVKWYPRQKSRKR
jgi:XisH protein